MPKGPRYLASEREGYAKICCDAYANRMSSLSSRVQYHYATEAMLHENHNINLYKKFIDLKIMENVDFKRNLKLTLDVIVPLVSAPLIFHGAFNEGYQIYHGFPAGSYLGEIAAGFTVAGIYFGFLRGKYLSELKGSSRLEFLNSGEDIGA